MIAQLLATEGFGSIEEVAFVEPSEIAQIEGFNDETAETIQGQARDYLSRQESERDAKRRELGVADELAEIAGVTTAMMVALGENGVKTVEDLADCATDELIGWTERKKEKDAESVRHKGYLDGFEIGRKEAEDLILNARVHAGWIKAEDLVQPEPEGDGETDDEAAETEAASGEVAGAKA